MKYKRLQFTEVLVIGTDGIPFDVFFRMRIEELFS